MEAVYIIHQTTGNCIIFRKYGELEFNEDLIAGFLTALKDFSTEVTGGKGKMKTLDMGDYRIILLYSQEAGVLVAGSLGKRDDENTAYKALSDLTEDFITEFKEALPSWNGNLKVFRGYEQKIDNLLKNGKVAEKELYAPMLKKKLPKQLVEMGALSKEEFTFADYFNGQDIPEDIAEKAGMPIDRVEIMVDKFKNLGLIKLNKV